MKRRITLALVSVAVLLAVLAVVLWPRALRGEHRSGRGTIYYFSDGVVMIDMNRQQPEFYIYAKHPGDKPVERTEFIDGGFEIWGPGVTDGAEEFIDGRIHVGYAAELQPGKVRLVENHGDWSEGRFVVIDPETILQFVQKGGLERLRPNCGKSR